MAKTDGVRFWSDSETRFMLCQLKELNISKYMDGRKTRNGDLFKKVAEEMDGAGFKRTPEQIRVRWKHMKQVYYNARKNNPATGRFPVPCPHNDILEELLGRRQLSHSVDPGVDIGFNPPASGKVLGTDVNHEETEQELDELELSERSSPLSSLIQRGRCPGSEQPGTSSPNLDLPRPPTDRRRRQVSDMDHFLKQMRQMQNAWMEQFQQSQEREERLVHSILQSNASLVSTLMEGIRSLQRSVPPTSSSQQTEPRRSESAKDIPTSMPLIHPKLEPEEQDISLVLVKGEEMEMETPPDPLGNLQQISSWNQPGRGRAVTKVETASEKELGV